MISGADGSSYVLTTQLDIHANHRYILSLNKDHTVSIAVADYTTNAEQGVAESVNKTFGIVAAPANLKNGEFNASIKSIIVIDPALEFNADFTIRSTSDEGIEVNISGDAGIVEDITVDKKGLVTRAPYYANTFSVKFAAGKFASDKEFNTTIQVTDKASAETFDIVIFHSDGTETVTPPSNDASGGFGAYEDILAVDSDGILNLDGRGKLVYFKWGSVIALSGGVNDDEFDITDVAWTPTEYKYLDIIGESTAAEAWAKIPYSTGNVITVDYARGLGDPCVVAMKGDVKGGYRMPTVLENVRFVAGPNPVYKTWSIGDDAYNYNHGKITTGEKQVNFFVMNGNNAVDPSSAWLPAIQGDQPNTSGKNLIAAGRRDSNGATAHIGKYGIYWSSTASSSTSAYNLYFLSNSLRPVNTNSFVVGHPVRCVKAE